MSLIGESPDILEVTLRDGSYLIDFQFTAEDTAIISSALDSAGFRWIELGHGLGLHASAAGKGTAAATDEEYLEAAAGAIKNARWGMFFIAGIGREEDLRLAAKYHMDFVRIGTNVTEIADAQPFIRLAKELGLIVSYNAMKSYAVPPAEFGRCASLARTWGADMVCLVDSAGGMFPDDVANYLRAASDECDAKLGFHGHDNLALAMANTLQAVDCGAVLVDSSLQGIGRSAGNTVTEVLVAVLKHRGFLPAIDLNTVTDLGQTLIEPALRRRGLDPMAVIGGAARFHSAFTTKVRAYARKYNLDVRDLIVRLCQEDQVNAPDELLDSLSRELAARRMPRNVTIRAFGRHRPSPANALDSLNALVKEIRPLAVKTGKFSTLNVVIGEEPQDQFKVSGNIQNTLAHIVGSVTLSSEEQLNSILNAVDGKVDVVFLDVDRRAFGPPTPAQTGRRYVQKSLLLTYSDSQLWVGAIAEQIVRLLDETLEETPLVVIGNHAKSRLLILHLVQRGARVTALIGPHETPPSLTLEAINCFSIVPLPVEVTSLASGSSAAVRRLRDARLVVVWTKGQPWFGREEVGHLKAETYVLDASIGAILPEGLDEAHRRGVLALRVNIWPSLTGTLLAAQESSRVYREDMGWGTLAGTPVVAGGAIGRLGDIIVNSTREPTRIMGIADGRSGILFDYSPEQTERVNKVVEEIRRRLVTPQSELTVLQESSMSPSAADYDRCRARDVTAFRTGTADLRTPRTDT